MPVPLNRLTAAFYRSQLSDAVPSLVRRMNAVADGRATPSLDSMSIGSGRKVSTAVIFFDICGFTQRTSSDNPDVLKLTLLLLNCVIPSMMRVLHRYRAYVEKNTGDGLMAILGIELDDATTASDAINVAEEMFYVLHHIVNPKLAELGVEPVDARIGIDMGTVLISRIGVPNGSAMHPRNSLTAVGPAANLACKIQGMAGVNEIWCGDSIRRLAPAHKIHLFDCTTPSGWTWNYGGNANAPYHCWRYNGVAQDPFTTILTAGFR